MRKSAEGFSAQTIPTRGIGENMPTNKLYLGDAFVPDEDVLGGEEGIGNGFKYAMNGLDSGRLTIPARPVSLAQASLELMID